MVVRAAKSTRSCIPAGHVGGDAPEVRGKGPDAKVAEGDVEKVGHHDVVRLEPGGPKLEVLVAARSNACPKREKKSKTMENSITQMIPSVIKRIIPYTS